MVVQYSLSTRFILIFKDTNKAVFLGMAAFQLPVFLFFSQFYSTFYWLNTGEERCNSTSKLWDWGADRLPSSTLEKQPRFSPIHQTHPAVKDLFWLIHFCFGVDFNKVLPQLQIHLERIITYYQMRSVWNRFCLYTVLLSSVHKLGYHQDMVSLSYLNVLHKTQVKW